MASFYQGGLGHTARTSECHILKPFHKCFDRLSLSLLYCQESGHCNLRIVFEEACKKELLQITLVFDGAFWKLHEPFEGKSFHSTDQQTRQDGIVIYYIPCLRLEVVYVLVP